MSGASPIACRTRRWRGSSCRFSDVRAGWRGATPARIIAAGALGRRAPPRDAPRLSGLSTVRPTFIVHSLAHARAALAAAAELNVPICLCSADSACASLGAAYFRSMIDLALQDFPGTDAIAVLDCGRSPGAALAAIHAGVKHIRGEFADPVASRIEDIARQAGAILMRWPSSGRSIDLAACAEVARTCREWLQNAANRQISAANGELPSLGGSCNKFGAFSQESGEIEA